MATKRKGKRANNGDGTFSVHGRHSNGEGSVYPLADGRWAATWWEPGRKYPRKATGKTREDAIQRRADRMGLPLTSDGVKTLGDLADWWLHHVHKSKVGEASWKKAEDRVARIKRTLGTRAPADITYPVVVEWQSKLLAGRKGRAKPNQDFGLAPKTVRLHRDTLSAVMDEAVKLELASGNPLPAIDAPTVTSDPKIALTTEHVAAIAGVATGHRLGAAVMALFLQGWRISEVLGLAWEDLDLDAGTASLQRASVYLDGTGQMLQPRAKSEGTHGVHWLAPTLITLLKQRRDEQDAERKTAGETWKTQRCDGRKVELVFTTTTGGLVLRQTVDTAIKRLGKKAGMDPEVMAKVATHTGRRTVVTAMYEGDMPIDDIARHVGHALPTTTAGYVKRLGKRPQQVAERAARLLDPSVKPAEKDESRDA